METDRATEARKEEELSHAASYAVGLSECEQHALYDSVSERCRQGIVL